MTQHHIATVHPQPSSILHNSTDVRRQYTRAAAKQVVQVISRKVNSWRKKAPSATPDMPQMMQGGH
ncbi:hypothetical protein [Marinobacter sp. ATCH36]|uniref:hypothetical protein n=1 Tax=Marinobacter sp. ATCH36 TaxID=2945106 RepID=UPI00202219A2|nr:hypothetical protein [Marinobacter sp. ATCH36]MCL7943810.1 hypothetical protein [Marinobacter sp. ATCH36]